MSSYFNKRACFMCNAPVNDDTGIIVRIKNYGVELCENCVDKYETYTRIRKNIEPHNPPSGVPWKTWKYNKLKVTRCPRCGSRARVSNAVAFSLYCPFCKLQVSQSRGYNAIAFDKSGEIDYLNIESYTPVVDFFEDIELEDENSRILEDLLK